MDFCARTLRRPLFCLGVCVIPGVDGGCLIRAKSNTLPSCGTPSLLAPLSHLMTEHFFFFLSPNLWKEVVLTVALARFLLSSYVMALCEEISVTKSEEPTASGDSVRHWWTNHFNSEPNAPPERPGPVVTCFTTINAPKKRKRSSSYVANVLLRLFIRWENILMPLN